MPHQHSKIIKKMIIHLTHCQSQRTIPALPLLSKRRIIPATQKKSSTLSSTIEDFSTANEVCPLKKSTTSEKTISTHLLSTFARAGTTYLRTFTFFVDRKRNWKNKNTKNPASVFSDAFNRTLGNERTSFEESDSH